MCRRNGLVQLVLLVWCLGNVAGSESWESAIGFQRFLDRLGDDRPLGREIAISQIEAAAVDGGYQPQDGSGEFEGEDAFAGKAFRTVSSASRASGHARLVGQFLYGTQETSGFGARSLSPSVQRIDLYRADVRDYLSKDFLQPASDAAPKVEHNAIQNHSWSGQMGGASVDYMNAKLRRLDHSIVRDDFLCVVALANGRDTPIPPLMASAYNVLTVGCSHGDHSRGVTHPDLDGPDRGKPDLVAPLSATSFATPVVSSAAAALLEHAKADPELTAAQHHPVLKAILMAGAEKAPLEGWERQDTRPFDPVFGAGQLNIDRSYQILTQRQWHQDTLSSEEMEVIPLTLSQPASSVSVVLSWSRQVRMKRGKVTGTSVADMSLRLYRVNQDGHLELIQESVSPNENREHLYLQGLSEGVYQLHIETDNTVSYGVAWMADEIPRPEMGWHGNTLTPTALVEGIRYEWQESFDLREWTIVRTFTGGEDAETTLSIQLEAPRAFYRLRALP